MVEATEDTIPLDEESKGNRESEMLDDPEIYMQNEK